MTIPATQTTMHRTWRLCAVLLLVFFFGSPLLPLAGADTPPEAALPACCRAHGQHHCATAPSLTMRDRAAVASRVLVHPQLTERCHCLAFAATFALDEIYRPAQAPSLQPPLPARTSIAIRREHARGQAFDRAQPKRGPPVTASPC